MSLGRDTGTGNWRQEGKPRGVVPGPTTALLMSQSQWCLWAFSYSNPLRHIPNQNKHPDKLHMQSSGRTRSSSKGDGALQVFIHCSAILFSPPHKVRSLFLLCSRKLLHSSFPSDPKPLPPRLGFPYSPTAPPRSS